MRSRFFVGALVLVGLAGAGAFASGAKAAPTKQWSIVRFANPVRVNGDLLMGDFLIVHDDAKMARGEPCTTFYRFIPGKGPQEEVLAFHCRPTQRDTCARTTLSYTYDPVLGIYKVTEYQFAGDSEGHGIPDIKTVARK